MTLLGTVNAAVMFAAGVILLVAVNAAIGAAVILLSIAVTVGVPALFLWRRSRLGRVEALPAPAAATPAP